MVELDSGRMTAFLADILGGPTALLGKQAEQSYFRTFRASSDARRSGQLVWRYLKQYVTR